MAQIDDMFLWANLQMAAKCRRQAKRIGISRSDRKRFIELAQYAEDRIRYRADFIIKQRALELERQRESDWNTVAKKLAAAGVSPDDPPPGPNDVVRMEYNPRTRRMEIVK